ncbi:MAG: thiol:disulfide interchange protein DsbA/DsbL [Burkholderiaceae bacterium]
MSKRDFLATTIALAAAAAATPALSLAQTKLTEGKDYRMVTPPQRTSAPDGKIEVIEFFWIACPHCRSLEPVILDWQKKLPADVYFRKVHVNFRVPAHQQLYYTLVALKQDEKLIHKVFEEIHDKKSRMNKPDEIFAWAAEQGLDAKQFEQTYGSFGVRTAMRRASQEVKAYGVDGVPALAINGKYYTAPSMTGSNGSVMQAVDALIERERKGG